MVNAQQNCKARREKSNSSYVKKVFLMTKTNPFKDQSKAWNIPWKANKSKANMPYKPKANWPWRKKIISSIHNSISKVNILTLQQKLTLMKLIPAIGAIELRKKRSFIKTFIKTAITIFTETKVNSSIQRVQAIQESLWMIQVLYLTKIKEYVKINLHLVNHRHLVI